MRQFSEGDTGESVNADVVPDRPVSDARTNFERRLTLAQKYGLVEAPRSKLDKAEWLEVHHQSLLRGDLKHGCSICYEPFRGESQVLLSCSHTFHKHCLSAFERFSKKRCCPLCRSIQYQKMMVTSARELYEERCATLIQSLYRGHLARKRYKHMLRMRPPTDASEKLDWCAQKLNEASGKYLKEMDEDDNDIDNLLAEIDCRIKLSKYARETADNKLRQPPSYVQVQSR